MAMPAHGRRRARYAAVEIQKYCIGALIVVTLLMGFYALFTPIETREPIKGSRKVTIEPGNSKQAPQRIREYEKKAPLQNQNISMEAGAVARLGDVTSIILSMMDRSKHHTLFAPLDSAMERISKMFLPANRKRLNQNLQNICSHLMSFALVARPLPLALLERQQPHGMRLESISGMAITIVAGGGGGGGGRRSVRVNGFAVVPTATVTMWGNVTIYQLDGCLMPAKFRQSLGSYDDSDDDAADEEARGEEDVGHKLAAARNHSSPVKVPAKENEEGEDKKQPQLLKGGEKSDKPAQERRTEALVVDPPPEVSEPRTVDPTPEVSEPRILDPTPEVSEPRIVDPAPEVSEARIVDPAPEVESSPAAGNTSSSAIVGAAGARLLLLPWEVSQADMEAEWRVEKDSLRRMFGDEAAQRLINKNAPRNKDEARAKTDRPPAALLQQTDLLDFDDLEEHQQAQPQEPNTKEMLEMQHPCSQRGIVSGALKCECAALFLGSNCQALRDMTDQVIQPYVGEGRTFMLLAAEVARATAIMAERERKHKQRLQELLRQNMTDDERQSRSSEDDELEEAEAEARAAGESEEEFENAVLNRRIKQLVPVVEALKDMNRQIKEDLTKYLPNDDPFQGAQVQRRCAVVGNSGSLLLADDTLGQEIDSHDFVIRFNGAPTRGYEHKVGSKTSLRLSTAEWAGFREQDEAVVYNLWMRDPMNELSRLVRFTRYRSLHTLLVLSPMFSFNLFTGLGNILSVGFMGIALALHMCVQVDVYGMYSGRVGGLAPYHYFDRQPTSRPAAELGYEYMSLADIVAARLIVFAQPCHTECSGNNVTLCAGCHGISVAMLEARGKWTSAQAVANEQREEKWKAFLHWEEKERMHWLHTLSHAMRTQQQQQPHVKEGSSSRNTSDDASSSILHWSSLIEGEMLSYLSTPSLLSYCREHHLTIPATRADMVKTITAHHHFRERNLNKQGHRTYEAGAFDFRRVIG